MKDINLLSLAQSRNDLNTDIYESYLNTYGIEIKDAEIEDLSQFIKSFPKFRKRLISLENYFVGYKIPQIGKEFDLLRFGKNYVLNIELKREQTLENIQKQLMRNNYYLTFLNKPIHCFAFVSKDKKVYYLNNNEIKEVNIDILCTLIEDQEVEEIKNIDVFFDPSNYLVSPFNSTDRFIEDKYFLTGQQEDFKRSILENFEKKQSQYVSLIGNPGTGKTLLAYHLARTYMDDYPDRVLIIHCGRLNAGQIQLNEQYNWDIVDIKTGARKDLSSYFLVVLDEVQRIRPYQLLDIIERAKTSSTNCIFSYDQRQCLREQESANNIDLLIKEKASPKEFKLTDKIRTNKNIANFIKSLFDGKVRTISSNENINVKYFRSAINAKEYSILLKEKGFKVINFTPSQHKKNSFEEHNLSEEYDNAHTVIGQEFDNVVAIIDQNFFYKDGKLAYRENTYYNPPKMLFQIMTRTRKQLTVIIINNPVLLKHCISILE